MTHEEDTELSDFFKTGVDEQAGRQETKTEERISLWLAGSIILFLVIVFAVAALIVQKVYFQPPVVRTAVERDLIKYKEAVKLNPRDAEAYVGLAGVYLEIEEVDKAIGQLDKAIEIEPRSWNAHFELGMAYISKQEPNIAASHFWQATSIDPNNELAFYQLGKLYQDQKQYGQAVQAFQRTLKINPTPADAHYFLGCCYEKTNKSDLAIKEYREALKYVQSYPEAEKALKRLEQ